MANPVIQFRAPPGTEEKLRIIAEARGLMWGGRGNVGALLREWVERGIEEHERARALESAFAKHKGESDEDQL